MANDQSLFILQATSTTAFTWIWN